jgi:hypothetical protein
MSVLFWDFSNLSNLDWTCLSTGIKPCNLIFNLKELLKIYNINVYICPGKYAEKTYP